MNNPATYLEIPKWNSFQHYGRRSPPWIKLHRALLDDYAFCKLPDASKGHLMLIWLLASQKDGMVPYDAGFIERKLSISNLDLELLIESGFLVRSNGASAERAE